MDLIQEINEGTGDTSLLEERLNQIFKDEAEEQKGNEEESLFFVKEYFHFVLSAILAYVILSIWAGLTIYFIVFAIVADDWKSDRVGNMGAQEGHQVDVNNISFGLVTAVVLQELNEGANDNESSLYKRFLVTCKKRLEQSKVCNQIRKLAKTWSIHHFSSKQEIFVFLFRCVRELIYSAYTWLILNSSRVYIVSWIIFGASSLIVGIATDVDATFPLHTIGETWIGIAVTIGYSFFALNSKNSLTVDDERSMNDE